MALFISACLVSLILGYFLALIAGRLVRKRREEMTSRGKGSDAGAFMMTRLADGVPRQTDDVRHSE
jgi:hypothetical protein